MNTAIRSHLAALNAAWQRYARTMEAQLDPVTVEVLSRDYLAAWEGLDACGIAEWMLVYDPATLTFSLPAMGVAHDAFATVPISAVTPRTAGSRGPGDEPHGAQM
jgi:hypothetical protein